jgi:hypothetical protein
LLYSEMGPSCSTYTQVSTTVPLHCLCELQYCKRIVDCYRPEKPLVEQIHKLCPFMQHVSEDNDLLMLSYIETHEHTCKLVRVYGLLELACQN